MQRLEEKNYTALDESYKPRRLDALSHSLSGNRVADRIPLKTSSSVEYEYHLQSLVQGINELRANEDRAAAATDVRLEIEGLRAAVEAGESGNTDVPLELVRAKLANLEASSAHLCKFTAQPAHAQTLREMGITFVHLYRSLGLDPPHGLVSEYIPDRHSSLAEAVEGDVEMKIQGDDGTAQQLHEEVAEDVDMSDEGESDLEREDRSRRSRSASQVVEDLAPCRGQGQHRRDFSQSQSSTDLGEEEDTRPPSPQIGKDMVIESPLVTHLSPPLTVYPPTRLTCCFSARIPLPSHRCLLPLRATSLCRHR